MIEWNYTGRMIIKRLTFKCKIWQCSNDHNTRGTVYFEGQINHQGCQIQKIKKAKFGHEQFQKRPNPEKWKKGQISLKIFVKITKLKLRSLHKCLKFAQVCPKQTLKYTIFVNIKKMAKPLYFCKQFQKRPNGNPEINPRLQPVVPNRSAANYCNSLHFWGFFCKMFTSPN